MAFSYGDFSGQTNEDGDLTFSHGNTRRPCAWGVARTTGGDFVARQSTDVQLTVRAYPPGEVGGTWWAKFDDVSEDS